MAKGDGTGVIIINQPTQGQVDKISAKMKKLNPNWCNVSIEQLNELVQFLEEVGIKDFYNSDKEYVNNKLTKINSYTADNHFYGLYIRNEEECKAVFIPGKVQFQGGSTASPQIFQRWSCNPTARK